MTKSTAQSTRTQLAEAALEALRSKGFAGATSREIARIGGFNQALIFYHYGTVDKLLLAALDLTSEQRLGRYRERVEQATNLEELIQVARLIYREDSESGHVAVVSQMVAGSLARPELAAGVLERVEPWIEFCEDALRKVIAGTPLEDTLPVNALAYGLVTFYLGANLFTHLGGAPQIDALFAQIEALSPAVSALLHQR